MLLNRRGYSKNNKKDLLNNIKSYPYKGKTTLFCLVFILILPTFADK